MGFLCKGQFFAFAHNILNIEFLPNVLSFFIPNINTGIQNTYFWNDIYLYLYKFKFNNDKKQQMKDS